MSRFEVLDYGIVKHRPEIGEGICEIMIPREVFIEAYEKYILQDLLNYKKALDKACDVIASIMPYDYESVECEHISYYKDRDKMKEWLLKDD